MIYFYEYPPVYGPVSKDGKQSISIYTPEDGARHTYITDKNKVDEFSSIMSQGKKDGTKSLLGFMTAMATSAMTLSEKTKIKAIGWGGVALGIGYGILKFIDAYKSEKKLEKIMNDFKNNGANVN